MLKVNRNIALRNLARHYYPRQRIIVFTAKLTENKWRTYIYNAESKRLLRRGELCLSEKDALDNLLTKMRTLAKVNL